VGDAGVRVAAIAHLTLRIAKRLQKTDGAARRPYHRKFFLKDMAASILGGGS
jgi:hypothetical protein